MDRPGSVAAWEAFYSSLGDYGDVATMQELHTGHTWQNSLRVIRAGIGDRISGRVLDAGCGWGRMAMGLLTPDFKGTLVGVDVASDAIAHAERTFESHPLTSRVTWTAAPLERLPFDDGEFDAVYSARVLHHLDQPEVALAELSRVTVPGGIMVGFVPNRWCPPNRSYYAATFSPKEVAGWFESAGWTVLRASAMDFVPSRLPVGESGRLRLEKALDRAPLLRYVGGKSVVVAVNSAPV